MFVRVYMLKQKDLKSRYYLDCILSLLLHTYLKGTVWTQMNGLKRGLLIGPGMFIFHQSIFQEKYRELKILQTDEFTTKNRNSANPRIIGWVKLFARKDFLLSSSKNFRKTIDSNKTP